MSEHRRLSLSKVDGVVVVRFVDRRILDAVAIEEMGDELLGLIEEPGRHQILLNFSDVTFMSSSALNKLIVLEKRVKEIKGKLKLCSLRPELREVFTITRLSTIFDISENEPDALKSF